MNLDDGIERFVRAQWDVYQSALEEIKDGKKQSHWMWYIFPQIRGLGFTDYNVYYGIKDIHEASEYLNDPILGKRLVEISEAVFRQQGKTALEIFGKPDDRKLKSCMTLFSQIQNTDPIFQKVLEKYYLGFPDDKTIAILTEQKSKS
ncbi:DUF1810 domain-containing protein [Flavobacterium sp. ACN6]|uniref:DUF1810 domain-containing protein n=1 Tax=Flavobacterium sp. ACN6 TaxID=1920426 RepID=UPI000BB3852C|nr:DUF1810 domain-containing protein [Flavobacterium sp. ACN6]PBJ08074.1 hypothetical protein BSF42_37910 [Flavobacterium sp. ACN6]